MGINYDPNVYFHEEQRFRQPWLIAVMVLGCAMSFAGVGLALSDADKARDGMHSAALILAVETLMVALVVVLFVTAKMVTEARYEGILVQGYPIARLRRLIPYSDIVSCEARNYSPIMEYGGWGIRRGPGGNAYNVSGNRGVQLLLRSGEKLLIGSQKADELAAAISARLAAA